MSYSLPVSLSSSSNAPQPMSEPSSSSPRTLNGSPVSVETNQSHDSKKVFDSATSKSPIQKGFSKDSSMSSKEVVSLSNSENKSDDEYPSIEHFPYGAFENEKHDFDVSSITSLDFQEGEGSLLQTGNLGSLLGGLSFDDDKPRNLLSPIPFEDIPVDSSFLLDDISGLSLDALTKNESSDLEEIKKSPSKMPELAKEVDVLSKKALFNGDSSIERFSYGAFENEKHDVSVSSIMSLDFQEGEGSFLEAGNLSSLLGGLSFDDDKPRNLLSPIPKVDFEDIPVESSFQLDAAITEFPLDAPTKNENSDSE